MKKWRYLWDRYYIWIGWGASGVLVAMCYGFVLRLPFFYDDLPIMTWLRHHDWLDIWTLSSENSYYRPLAFTIYKAGHLFPPGTRQVILHGINLFIHWTSALLVMQVVRLGNKSSQRAVLAALLFAVFPYVFLAVPWITALSHPLVTMLTLLAVYAALKADRGNATWWWAISLFATALAPFAHESGAVCAVIVAGMVMIQGSASPGRRRIVGIILGGMLNVGAVVLRSQVPGVGTMQWAGWSDLPQNVAFFLHGLVYPAAPIIGWLANQWMWPDLGLVGITSVCLCLLLVWLARRSRDWRWIASNLWWWALGAFPALVSIPYGGLYTSPRLHSLASAGVVMLWANVIVELGQALRNQWGRRLAWGLLVGVIGIQNITFLGHQRTLFTL